MKLTKRELKEGIKLIDEWGYEVGKQIKELQKSSLYMSTCEHLRCKRVQADYLSGEMELEVFALGGTEEYHEGCEENLDRFLTTLSYVLGNSSGGKITLKDITEHPWMSPVSVV